MSKQEKVTVSDLERTVLDGLRQPEYCGGVTEVAKGLWIRRADINVTRLIGYALRLNVAAVMHRLGFLMEVYRPGHCGRQRAAAGACFRDVFAP